MARNTLIGPDYYEPFPVNLRSLMDAFGTKNVTLAEYLGVSGTVIGNYRKGTDKPDWKKIVKIADFFHVTTDFLLGREQAPFFASPDLEEIGFSMEAELALKALSTNRALEKDTEGIYHRVFDELNSFLASQNLFIFMTLLSNAKEAANDSRLKLEALLQDSGKKEDIDTMLLQFYSTSIKSTKVEQGYMFARYQVERQLSELLDDYFHDAEMRQLLGKLERKAAIRRKELEEQKKAGKTVQKKEARNGNDSEN